MSESFNAKHALRTMKAPGTIALALTAMGAWIVLGGLFDVASVLVISKPKQLESPAIDKEQSAKRASQYESFLAQINGRSLLITPAAPSKGAPVVEEVEDPRPTVYGGPSLSAMMLDSAWFSDGSRLDVGGPAKGDLRVISLNPPWDVKVEWKGVEFVVPLFEKNKVVFKDDMKPNENK